VCTCGGDGDELEVKFTCTRQPGSCCAEANGINPGSTVINKVHERVLHLLLSICCVLQSFQLGTVISNGVASNLSVNALYAGPYATLVSNVNFGAARNPYGLSGAGPKTSSFSTFWNVRVSCNLQQMHSSCASVLHTTHCVCSVARALGDSLASVSQRGRGQDIIFQNLLECQRELQSAVPDCCRPSNVCSVDQILSSSLASAWQGV
jgi:hypothetical protein